MTKQKTGNWFARHKVLTVIGGFFLFVILLGAIGGGNKNKTVTTTTKTTTATKANATPTTKVNQEANDGKFAFTITGVQCDTASVGSSQYSTKNAQGQYCVVSITVRNIGNEAQTLDSFNQYLYNSEGKKYSADSEASYDANPSGSTFLQQINPGVTVSGVVVFDMPKGVTPTVAELHDSAFSNGVKVNLQ